jgi:predicted acylesterase/phospholipase RssA
MLGRLRTVVGCSAGALVGLMVVVGLKSAEIASWACRGIDDGTLSDVDIDGVLPFLMMRRLGLDSGERVVESIRAALRSSPLPLLRGRDDATFLELAKATGRDFVVGVTNLDTCKRELLSVDTTPDLSVVTAIRMSISVPFLFTPVLYQGCMYADGALLDFCPIDHIRHSGTATSSLVLKLNFGCGLTASGRGERREPPDLMTYIGLLARAVLSSSIERPGMPADVTCVKVVEIPELNVGWALSMDTLSMTLGGGGATAEAVERFLRHGEAIMASALLSTIT